MLTREIDGEILNRYKDFYDVYRDKLVIGRKSGEELLNYLCGKYNLRELNDVRSLSVVSENVLSNECFSQRLVKGETVCPKAFIVENDECSSEIYSQRGNFPEMPVFAGIDLTTGYFCVEGSEKLWDELNAYRGIDELDAENFCVVGMYVESLENEGLLFDGKHIMQKDRI